MQVSTGKMSVNSSSQINSQNALSALGTAALAVAAIPTLALAAIAAGTPTLKRSIGKFVSENESIYHIASNGQRTALSDVFGVAYLVLQEIEPALAQNYGSAEELKSHYLTGKNNNEVAVTRENFGNVLTSILVRAGVSREEAARAVVEIPQEVVAQFIINSAQNGEISILKREDQQSTENKRNTSIQQGSVSPILGSFRNSEAGVLNLDGNTSPSTMIGANLESVSQVSGISPRSSVLSADPAAQADRIGTIQRAKAAAERQASHIMGGVAGLEFLDRNTSSSNQESPANQPNTARDIGNLESQNGIQAISMDVLRTVALPQQQQQTSTKKLKKHKHKGKNKSGTGIMSTSQEHKGDEAKAKFDLYSQELKKLGIKENTDPAHIEALRQIEVYNKNNQSGIELTPENVEAAARLFAQSREISYESVRKRVQEMHDEKQMVDAGQHIRPANLTMRRDQGEVLKLISDIFGNIEYTLPADFKN